MKKNIVVMAILSAIATHALAGGMYAALDAGQSKVKDACTGVTAPLSCSDSGTAFRISAGYSLNPNLAIEASYARPATIKMTDPGVGYAEAKSTLLAATVVGTIPLQSGFSLLGKLGVSRSSTDFSGSAATPGNTSSTGLAWGIGAQYEVNPQIAVRAQYELLGRLLGQNNQTVDVNMLSGGIVFRF